MRRGMRRGEPPGLEAVPHGEGSPYRSAPRSVVRGPETRTSGLLAAVMIAYVVILGAFGALRDPFVLAFGLAAIVVAVAQAAR